MDDKGTKGKKKKDERRTRKGKETKRTAPPPITLETLDQHLSCTRGSCNKDEVRREIKKEKKMKKMNERIFLLLVDVKPLVDALGVEVVLARKALQLASFLVLAETNGTNSVLLFH